MRRPLCSNIMDMTSLNENLTSGRGICSQDMQEAANQPLPKTKVFGVSLDTLRSYTDMVIPYALTRICSFIENNALDTKGLFVQNGESCLIEDLKSLFDQSGDAPLENVDVASVAQLLMVFFKELPEPLIPSHLHPTVFRGLEVSTNNHEDWTRHLKSFVGKLPNTSFNVLKYFSHFLFRVTCHENFNETSSQDLGSIFGPVLFGLAEERADPIELSLSREIVGCFMDDYQAIFEGDAELSCTEDVPIQLVSRLNQPVRIMASAAGRTKMSPMPSSVMPLVPMEPLSVVIPSDGSLQDDIQDAVLVQNVPVLLVESFRYPEDTDTFSKGILSEEIKFQADEKLGTIFPSRRKRKERRPSGEDLQPPRSSSEERPPPSRSDELFVKSDQIRRCSSHEEMKVLARVAWENGFCEEKVCEEDLREFGSPSNVTLSLKPAYRDLRDHSPHPPKPKRRELDSSEILQTSLVKQTSQFEETQDYHEIQRNSERFTTFHWSSMARSRYVSPRSFKCNCSRKSTSKKFSKKLSEQESFEDCDTAIMEQKICLNDQTSEVSEEIVMQELCDGLAEKFSSRKFCPLHSLLPQNSNPYNQEGRTHHGPHDGKLSHPLLEQHPMQEQSEEVNENGVNMDESPEAIESCSGFIPPLDFSALHEHDEAEPVRSEHRHSWPLLKVQEDDALLSPSVHHLRKSNSCEAPLSPSAYRSYLSYRSMHFDPNVPPSPPVEQDDFGKSTLKEEEATTATMKQLAKRVHSLKKKIRHFEETFENEHGYRPSHAEKTSHHDIKKLMSDLNKARKELKSLKEEAQSIPPVTPLSQWFPTREAHILEDTTNNVSTLRHSDGISSDEAKSKFSIENLLDDALNFLSAKRRQAHRPESVEDMTSDQVTEEKLEIQKALLHFESIHGRPSNKLDRDIMRPLYDRYRNVKRVLVRSSSLGSIGKSKDPGTELPPILEHETMDFTSPQHRSLSLEPLPTSDETPVQEMKAIWQGPQLPEVLPEGSESSHDETDQTSSALQYLADKYNNSNLHELPLSELLLQQQQARTEKRKIRRILRDFEEDFQKQAGRKVQKEDRTSMETVYAEYKHVKARLRLLEALVSKHEQHTLK